MTLLGGATHFEREVELWEKTLSQTVAGKIKNAYSRRDFILGFYFASQRHDSIGRHLPFLKSPNNLKGSDGVSEVFRLKSYENKYGHMEYRDKLVEIAT